MKQLFLIFAVLLVFSACSKEKTISEELVGDWIYERETFNSFSTFEDPDTEGFITFNEDETGFWNSNNTFQDYTIEWDLQVNDEKISITKYFNSPITVIPFTTIYDITRTNEDKFTFTFHFKSESIIDSIETFEQFENIILTRME